MKISDRESPRPEHHPSAVELCWSNVHEVEAVLHEILDHIETGKQIDVPKLRKYLNPR